MVLSRSSMPRRERRRCGPQDSMANADAVLYVMGYEADDEGEYTTPWIKKKGKKNWGQGGDRPNMFLKPKEQILLKELLPVNANSIVVLIGGSGIMTNDWDTHATSILMAWYPGMMGGQALSNILFGVVNPCGKLPLTIPAREQDLPYFKADIDSIHYGYYHGYTLLDKSNLQAAYPFGFGLSYTTFTYANIRMDNDHIGVTDTLHVSVDVTNTGHVAGEEVVQLYLGFEHSAVDRPVKLLRGFEKTMIAPSETKTITIPVSARDLAWYNPDTRAWVVDEMEYEVYVGSSSAERDLLKTSFSVEK
jgi:beta-glucosidase